MFENIVKLNGVLLVSKKEQKKINGGVINIGGVPIASTCDFSSFQSCANSCTAPGTSCGPCLDNNASPGTYECRFNGFGF